MSSLRKPPIDYEEAFSFKSSFELEDEDDTFKNCSIDVDRLPDLCLTTGKIVVGDPFSIEDSRAIAKRVRPGTYRVERAARKDTRPDHPGSYWYEVACVRIVGTEKVSVGQKRCQDRKGVRTEKVSGTVSGDKSGNPMRNQLTVPDTFSSSKSNTRRVTKGASAVTRGTALRWMFESLK